MKKLSTWKATWQLIRVHPSSFATMWVLYVVGFLCLIAPGLVLQAIFDHLTDAGPLDHGVWSLLALMAGVGMARALLDYVQRGRLPLPWLGTDSRQHRIRRPAPSRRGPAPGFTG
jgi:hypothetical protein